MRLLEVDPTDPLRQAPTLLEVLLRCHVVHKHGPSGGTASNGPLLSFYRRVQPLLGCSLVRLSALQHTDGRSSRRAPACHCTRYPAILLSCIPPPYCCEPTSYEVALSCFEPRVLFCEPVSFRVP